MGKARINVIGIAIRKTVPRGNIERFGIFAIGVIRYSPRKRRTRIDRRPTVFRVTAFDRQVGIICQIDRHIRRKEFMGIAPIIQCGTFILIGGIHPDPQSIINRAGNIEFAPVTVVAPRFDFALRMEIRQRLFRHNVDCAARLHLAVKHRRRTIKHFNTLNIGKIGRMICSGKTKTVR